jgi:UDP-glucose 4-epimerase
MLSGEPVVVFGDGSASRDYLHVDDLCRGIALALEKDLPGGTILHLASGVETTVSELASKLARIAGKDRYPIEFRPARRGEVMRNFARFDKAKKILGFEPTIDLDAGLAMTWRWYASRRDEVLLVETSDS